MIADSGIAANSVITFGYQGYHISYATSFNAWSHETLGFRAGITGLLNGNIVPDRGKTGITGAILRTGRAGC